MRSLLRPVLTLLIGSGAAQVITLLLSPVLSRLYSPDNFGVLAVYGSLVSVFGVIACLRLDLAVVVPRDDSEAIRVIRAAFWLACVVGTVLILVGLVFGGPIARTFGQPALQPYLPLVGLTVLSYGIFNCMVQWNARTNRFRRVANAQLGRSVVTNSVQLLGSLFGIGGGGLVIGQFLGQLSTSARLLLGSGLLRRVSVPSVSELRGVLRDYREFSTYGTPQALLNAVSLSLPNLVFSALISPAAAGLYALTHRVLAAPARLVGESLRQALYPRLARSLESDGTLKLALRMISMMALLVVVPLGAVAYAGPWLFTNLFGEQWFEAGHMARYLVFGTAMGFMNIPSACLMQLLRLQHVHLVYEVVYVIARATALVTGALQGDALLSVILYVVTGVAFNLVLIVIPLIVLARRPRSRQVDSA